jgi:hypothetical protein
MIAPIFPRLLYSAISLAGFFLCELKRAEADTSTLFPLKDNTIFSERTTASFGAGDYLYSGRISNGIRRALVSFDINTIPDGSTITDVTLTMRVDRHGPSFVNETVRLFRVTSDWGEAVSDAASNGAVGSRNGGGDGAAAQPQDATWSARFHPSTPWIAAGGDFATQETASRTVTTFANGVITPVTWTSSATNRLIADVQGWVDGTFDNFGWIIRADEAQSFTALRLLSGEHQQQANWPRLDIEFTPPPPPGRIPGDVDNMNGVTLHDLNLLTANLGMTGIPVAERENQGDFTNDGSVGIRDLIILRNNLGRTSPSPALDAPAVPEPATGIVSVGLAIAFFGRYAARRRRLHAD